MIRDAFRDRQKSDYETIVNFSKEQATEMFEDMKIFIFKIENFILNENS